MVRNCLVVAAFLLAGVGCLKTNNVLTVNADGSGSLSVERTISKPVVQAMQQQDAMAAPHMMRVLGRLPLTEEDIRKFGKADGIEVKDVLVEPTEDGGLHTRFTLEFADIQAFAKGTGGQFLPFRLSKRDDGKVAFALEGTWTEMARELAQGTGREQLTKQLPVLKVQWRGGAQRTEVVLPGKVESAVGGTVDGNRVVWDWQVDTLEVTDFIGDDGTPKAPVAVFAGDAIEFALPVHAKAPAIETMHGAPTTGDDWEEIPLVERGAAEQAARFVVRATNLSGNASIDFGGGKPNRRSSCSLRLSISCPADMHLVKGGTVEIESLLTAAGEQFADQCRPQAVNVNESSSGGASRADVHIQMPESMLMASGIRELRGYAELAYAPEIAELRIDPIGDHLGTPQPCPDLPEVAVTILDSTPHTVQVRFSGGSRDKLSGITWLKADGTEINREYQTRSRDTETYHVQVPPDGAAVFRFARELRRERIPIALTDIPISAAVDPEGLPLATPADFPARIERIDRHVNLDLNGGIAVGQNTMTNVNLLFGCPEDIKPMTIADLRVDEALGPDGGRLEIRADRMTNQHVHAYPRGREGNAFSVRLLADEQLMRIPRIERLAGSFVLTYADGGRRAVAEPAGDWVGKTLTVPDLPGAEIHVVAIGPDKTVIRYSNAVNQVLEKAVFETAAGDQIPTRGVNGRGDGTYMTNTYDGVVVPADGRIVFMLYRDISRVQVPFEIVDLPLE